MKNVFKGFYNIEKPILKELWKDKKTLFVFDSSVLLNLYGYAKQTRDDFFSILDVVNDKSWIPYQVGLEYQNRRLKIISREKNVFNGIENILTKTQKELINEFDKLGLKRKFPRLHDDTVKLTNEIDQSILNYKTLVTKWNTEQPCVRSRDEIREKINEIFNGKVGNKPESQEWLNEIYLDGERRFKNKIPPGFEDINKSKKGEKAFFHNEGLRYEKMYGDLILWKQLIHKSKSEDIENVILITDETKQDWWHQESSNGKKIIGPLPELASEIYRESAIKNFHMCSASTFLNDGKEMLSIDVHESSIKEISDARSAAMLRFKNITKDINLLPFNRNGLGLPQFKNIRLRDMDLSHDITSTDIERFEDEVDCSNGISLSELERLKHLISILKSHKGSDSLYKNILNWIDDEDKDEDKDDR